MRNALPIRKVATGLVASGVYYAAHRAGLTLLSHPEANDAAQGLVGFVVAYIVPDPRVRKLERKAKVGLVAKLRALNVLLSQVDDVAAAKVQSAPVAPGPAVIVPATAVDPLAPTPQA